MSAVTTHFEHVVRSKLIANKLAGTKPDSIRGLARAMANGDDALSKTYKRSLHKWMAPGGPSPTPPSRALVAHHLGVHPDELAEPDDEEADPVSFGDALQRMFDQAVERALDRRLAALREKR